MSDSLPENWLQEAVQLRLPSGRVRYLIQAGVEKCDHCPTGTRTVTVWVTVRGRGEVVAWCSHCFNATCEPVSLDDEHRRRHQQVLAAVARGSISPPWMAVRPALEDLERRGLLSAWQR